MSASDDLAGLLARRLSVREGADVTVTDLRRLTAGASRETWTFTAHLADGRTRRLVLRRDPPAAPRPDRMAREAGVLAAAARAGVPVPALVDHGTDPDLLGAPYLITAHVDGETIPRRVLRDERFARARPAVAADLGRTLARIHAVPPDDVPDLPGGDPLDRLRDAYGEAGVPLAGVEIALRWLDAHRPEPVPDTVVHGDFRLGNLMIDEDGLRAVLDWELVHRGDPREDLGFVCLKTWRFGAELPVGGLATLDELLDGYADVAGHRPDPEAVRWWQVWGTTWWAIGTQTMARRHLSGETPSVELAAIGRRTSEQEHDILLALGRPARPRDAEAVRPPELFGRPTAAEVTAAVAQFLRDDVRPAADERLAFLARVAANALDIVGREIQLGPALAARNPDRLADAIRSGELDAGDERTIAAVREAVTDRLLVDSPRYLTQPDVPLI